MPVRYFETGSPRRTGLESDGGLIFLEWGYNEGDLINFLCLKSLITKNILQGQNSLTGSMQKSLQAKRYCEKSYDNPTEITHL